MESLDELKARRARLAGIRYGGASRVKHGNKDTQFRSDEDLARAIRDLDDRIARTEGRGRPRFDRAVYIGKGL
ncbi:phage head-tail joining protein [Fodinicurvata sp. EGI_FJ10296]|uniref:phage head-tail joining protein n=1 Tax=Fodinicurvata sp. EGI_FJ10296 TaxID=3231908 RepID=UPI003456177C